MKKMYFIVTILVGAATFAAGFLLRPLIRPGEERQETTEESAQDTAVEVRQQELSAQELAAQGYLPLETLKIRIDDGEVQWYDGTVWHTVATVEEMGREDKFYVAQENFKEFEKQMKQESEAHRAEQESIGGQEETLLVGQKVEPKPTEKPKPTQPTVTAPVPVPEPTAPPEDNEESQDESSEESDPDDGDSGNTGGDNSGGGDTGDGENMEWSDDYL